MVLPGRRGSAALGAASRGGPKAFVEDLGTQKSVRDLRPPPAFPPPRAPAPLPFRPNTPSGLWLRALLGGQDCRLGVPCPLLCLLLAGQSDVLAGDGACGWQGPAGRLIFKVHVVLETCHHRVPCLGLPVAAGRAGQSDVTRRAQSTHSSLQAWACAAALPYVDTAKGHQLPGQPGGSPVGGGRHMCEKSRSGGGSERDGVLGRVRGGASGGHKLAPPLHTRPAPGKKCTAALLPQAPSSRPGLCSQAAAAQGQARGTPAES